MRSSKSRSRNKSNRNRPNTVGNVVNRVFDSSGPEGKVRGTPQQIIEKYNQLARDAQLSNDRVATENFQQHAEHYLRLLSAAQKEMDAKREQQERENRDRQVDRDRAPQDGGGNDNGGSQQPDVQENQSHDEASTLVETPESKSEPKQRAPRKPRHKPQLEGEAQTDGASDEGTQDSQSEQPKSQPRPRRARKPKADPSQGDQAQSDRSDGDNGNSETAAE